MVSGITRLENPNCMNNKRLKVKKSRKKAAPLTRQYLRFFAPPRVPQPESGDFYFGDPSPLKWVPSETTYGIGTLL